MLLVRLCQLLLAALLVVPVGARALEIALSDAAAGDNSSGAFLVTTHTAPFQISNDGQVEHRAAVEFDLRGILGSDARITAATVKISGRADLEKTLFIHLYGSNDGVVTDGDLDLGGPIPFASANLVPGAQDITFDISEFLIELDGSYPPFLGVNWRESISAGNLVAIEYLFLAQLLQVPEPGTFALLALGLAALAIGRGAARRVIRS